MGNKTQLKRRGFIFVDLCPRGPIRTGKNIHYRNNIKLPFYRGQNRFAIAMMYRCFQYSDGLNDSPTKSFFFFKSPTYKLTKKKKKCYI